MKNKDISRCLTVSIDYDSNNDEGRMIIAEQLTNGRICIINQLNNDEALKVYDELIGRKEECCKTCKYGIKYTNSNMCVCTHEEHAGDFVRDYTVCKHWI